MHPERIVALGATGTAHYHEADIGAAEHVQSTDGDVDTLAVQGQRQATGVGSGTCRRGRKLSAEEEDS